MYALFFIRIYKTKTKTKLFSYTPSQESRPANAYLSNFRMLPITNAGANKGLKNRVNKADDVTFLSTMNTHRSST